ncbi:uncharacterized protein LOC133034240 [Cannabis sativa]|uniref:uncharacterized protein LOC133034240 n=1 Tax=Cannabis sativa TaxID=3483 RepID=UPI0029CA9865|nr:uncharacterized protein LOC133034240 [Cannabis sativa]
MNRNLIRTILGRVWGLAEVDSGVKIKKVTIEASFLIFSFKNESDLSRIVNKSPWMLNNGVLILQRFSKLPSNWEVEMNRFPLMGRVLNLPTKAITKNNMLRLASMAGEVIEIQKEEVTKITVNGYFWFKVWIAIDKPLCPGFLYPNSGDRIWLPFRYERLPFMCFSCGKIGHDFRSCASHPVTVVDGKGRSSAAFGAWLKIDDKPMGQKGRTENTEDGEKGTNFIQPAVSLKGISEVEKSQLVKSLGEVLNPTLLQELPTRILCVGRYKLLKLLFHSNL